MMRQFITNQMKFGRKELLNDPLHAPFHRYLEKRFLINNNQGDFGEGLVITWDEDILEIPVQIPELDASNLNGTYDLYIRYMQNKGWRDFRS